MNTKRAFTMVELIFVIVILGILAAVAVPKLNASREDAKVAAVVADMRTIWGDIHSYYAANGEIAWGTKIAPMTNVPIVNTIYDGLYKVDGAECLRFFTSTKANCLTILRSKDASDACRKAVEKAEFLRGHQHFIKPWCTNEIRASKVTSLHESQAGSSDFQGIVLFFGEDGVQFD